MNAEYLLEAVGLIDDDLIAGAMEAPARQAAPRPRLRRWAALAACLALAAALGRFALPAMTGGMIGSESTGDAASPNSSSGGGGAGPSLSGAAGEGDSAGQAAPEEPGCDSESTAGDRNFAVMVDGTVYWYTGRVLAGEVDPSDIRGNTVYTDTALPEAEGEANFTGSCPYALTGDGAAVLMEGEWVLFSPTPPWEAGG